jgi:hypothetical protein
MMLARLVTIVAAALSTTATATAAIAQPIAVTADVGGDQTPSLSVSSSVLVQGGTATVTYSNAAMAGQTVVVDIDNGSRRNLVTCTLEITLDANGNGSAAWTVPTWDVAKFNAPGAAEVSCIICR